MEERSVGTLIEAIHLLFADVTVEPPVRRPDTSPDRPAEGARQPRSPLRGLRTDHIVPTLRVSSPLFPAVLIEVEGAARRRLSPPSRANPSGIRDHALTEQLRPLTSSTVACNPAHFCISEVVYANHTVT